MAIHDLWSYDNAPVGTNLTGGTTNVPGQYAMQTGLPGGIYNTGASTASSSVTSDGFLTHTTGTSQYHNALSVPVVGLFNFSSVTQFWFGFRTKSTLLPTILNVPIVSYGTAFATATTYLLTEAQLASLVNQEYYVEVFINVTAGTFQTYVNGALVNSGSVAFASTGFLNFGALGSPGAAGSNVTRGYRDFYFLDVDGTDTTRLGPIRSSRATLSNISGTEWTLNSSADLPTAITTALQNPPVSTPSANSPADSQPLTASLSTSVTLPILAVQPQLTYVGDAAQNSIDVSLVQASQTLDVGALALLTNTTQYNQRWPVQRKAPDGGAWTPAKVNATQAKLTGTILPPTYALLHMDGVNGAQTTTDAKGHTVAITGTGTLSTTQSKFGGSAYFPSTAGNLKITDSGDLASPGDFTIEFWSYLNSVPSSAFACHRNSSGGVQTALLILSGNVVLAMDDGTSAFSVATATAGFVAGVWQHIAVVKTGGVAKLYINGVQGASGAVTATWGNVSIPLAIGSNGLGGNAWPGYIDEFRFSKVARYAAAFTPPSFPFIADNTPIASAVSGTTLAISAPTSATTIQAQLQTIAIAAGLNLLPNDITDGPIAANATSVTLSVASTSSSYLAGSTVTLAYKVLAKTALLMHMDNPGTGTFTDVVGHTVAAAGGVVAGNGGKFGSGFYPSGTAGTYLQITDAADLHLLGDCTIEFFCIHANVSQNGFILAKGISTQTGFQYIQSTSGLLRIMDPTGTVIVGTASAAPLKVGVWQHIAFVKASGVWTLWIDGVSIASATNSAVWGNNAFPTYVGAFSNAGSFLEFSGSIDELRLSQCARYKTAFTPPQAPFGADGVAIASVFNSTALSVIAPNTATTILAQLNTLAVASGVNLVPEDLVDGPIAANATTVTLTAAATSMTYTPGSTVTLTYSAAILNNTALLMHFDGGIGSTIFTDAVGHTVTSVGGAKLGSTSKFGTTALAPVAASTPNVYVSIPDSPDLQFTGDFTVEFFLTALSNSVVDGGMVFGKGKAYVRYYNNTLYFVGDAGSGQIIGATPSWTVGTWHHVAVVKSAGTYSLYFDGVSVASPVASTQTFGVSSNPLTIGSDNIGDNGFQGSIDEFRISNVARYTAAFTPPNAPFTVAGNTVFLSHFDGSDPVTGTLTSPAVLGTPAKFGTGALIVSNTTNAKLTYAGASSPQLSSDFTIEAFCYYTAVTANGSMLLDKAVSASVRAYVYLINRQLKVLCDDGTTLTIGTTTALPAAGSAYFHFALVKQGTTWTAYVNGVSIGTATSTATWGVNTGNMVVGNTYDNGACPFTGAIDELRISKIARYTGNFTPPTVAFVAD
jgi:hypothetical protein